jgi:hypothetical protein
MNTKQGKPTIEFGKGQYIVTTTINTLIFKKVEPIVTTNTTIDNGTVSNGQLKQYKVVNQFNVQLATIDDIHEIKKHLSNSYEQKVFEYKDIVFDFTLYDRKTIDHILDQISWIEKFIPKSYLV